MNRTTEIALKYTSADTLAESLDLPREVYAFLWNEIVPIQAEFQGDNHAECGLFNHWIKVPAEYQTDIIKAIEEATQ